MIDSLQTSPIFRSSLTDMNYFIWWLIHSGGGKKTASMYVWHPISCWWRTRATFWGEGGGIWSWMRCSSSKTWQRNTGKPSLLWKGELGHLFISHLIFGMPDDHCNKLVCNICFMILGKLSCLRLSSSEQRILLINTPLQNTLKELWTMIHFLLPGITRPFSDFPVKASTDQNQDYCHKLVIRLHRVC